MNVIDLQGTWEAVQKGHDESFSGTVPGCVQTDLLAAGLIDDPFYRDNEQRQMPIGESDWIYRRTFDVSPDFLSNDRILLQCEGLDTFAKITLNGKKVASTDNQFRVWEFDVKKFLKEGANEIAVAFSSPVPYINKMQSKHYLHHTGIGHHRLSGGNWVRKAQYSFGWDWGPMCVTIGIWRPIRLLGFSGLRITDLQIEQKRLNKKSVELAVRTRFESTADAAFHLDVSLSFGGEEIASSRAVVTGHHADAVIPLENPELWWPNGLGEQPLYEVKAVASDDDGALIEAMERKIGIRTLELVREKDERGESFAFAVNGRQIFAKGANWIPADAFVTRLTPERYEQLVKSAADANMNMLRVWGGGIYEDDVFYDLCDRYGILVWQDFMFSCSAYPAFDAAFLENVGEEAKDAVRRLRHHPSLALWCGNNELELIPGLVGDDAAKGEMSWKDYGKLFDKLLPKITSKLDPGRPYWPSSPHTPLGNREAANDPASGDAHLWQVWHGRQPFEWYRSCTHRFNSEFGFQSFPEPRVVEAYTAPEDRNISSYIMEYHQRSAIGNDAIIQYMLSWFRLPSTFEMTLWLSQILQGIAVKYAVEHWRRNMPEGMGTLFWQLNDCWPAPSWSSIDYEGNWKALHYMARRFYAPLLLSAVEDPLDYSVTFAVTNDHFSPVKGAVSWQLLTLHGEQLDSAEFEVKVPKASSRKVKKLKLGRHIGQHGARNVVLRFTLSVDGDVISSDVLTFVRPKHLRLEKPSFDYSSERLSDGAYLVKLRSDRPALWVWPEYTGGGASYSDRFFHLAGEEEKEILIRPDEPLEPDEFSRHLTIRSLRDSWE